MFSDFFGWMTRQLLDWIPSPSEMAATLLTAIAWVLDLFFELAGLVVGNNWDGFYEWATAENGSIQGCLEVGLFFIGVLVHPQLARETVATGIVWTFLCYMVRATLYIKGVIYPSSSS